MHAAENVFGVADLMGFRALALSDLPSRSELHLFMW